MSKKVVPMEEYLLKKFGKEPPTNATGRHFRWESLQNLTKLIAERGEINLNEVRKWAIANMQCVTYRTLDEGYIDVLVDLEIIKIRHDSPAVLVWVGKE